MLDFEAPLNAIVAILKAFPDLADDVTVTPTQEYVKVGVPESFGTRTSAFVAYAGFTSETVVTQVEEVEVSYFVSIGYAVEGAEDEAERAVARTCALLAMKMLTVGGRRLDGLLVNGADVDARIDGAISIGPQYAPRAGDEWRVAEALIYVKQRTNF